MRKFYLSLVAALAASPVVSAQDAAVTHYLREIMTFDGGNKSEYTYTADGKLLTALNANDDEPSMSTRMEVIYNNAGQVSAIKTYQDVAATSDPEKYMHMSTMEYTYDDAGNVVERKVYNAAEAGAEPTLASRFVMTYNADKTLKTQQVFIDGMGTDPIQTYTYKYTSGRLTRTELSYSMVGMSGLSAVTEYEYDSTGRPIRQREYSYITGENRLSATMSVDYVYADNGALKSVDEYSSDRLMLVQQRIYESTDEFSVSEIAVPVTVEDDFGATQLSPYELTAKPLIGYEARAFNEYSGMTEPYANYAMTYFSTPTGDDNPNPPTPPGPGNGDDKDGIDTAVTSAALSIAAVTQSSLTLNGVADGCRVSIVNAEGATFINTRYGRGGIAIDALPAGVYFAVTGRGVVKFSKP